MEPGQQSSDVQTAQFMTLLAAYIELVRELVIAGVIDKDAMPKRLDVAEGSFASIGDETSRRIMSIIKAGVTPE